MQKKPQQLQVMSNHIGTMGRNGQEENSGRTRLRKSSTSDLKLSFSDEAQYPQSYTVVI